VTENRAVSETFGPRWDELTRVLRRLHNEELYDLVLLTKHCLDDQIKDNEMDRFCGTYGRVEEFIQGFGEDAKGEKKATCKT
jgi:hypothetical protein